MIAHLNTRIVHERKKQNSSFLCFLNFIFAKFMSTHYTIHRVFRRTDFAVPPFASAAATQLSTNTRQKNT